MCLYTGEDKNLVGNARGRLWRRPIQLHHHNLSIIAIFLFELCWRRSRLQVGVFNFVIAIFLKVDFVDFVAWKAGGDARLCRFFHQLLKCLWIIGIFDIGTLSRKFSAFHWCGWFCNCDFNWCRFRWFSPFFCVKWGGFCWFSLDFRDSWRILEGFFEILEISSSCIDLNSIKSVEWSGGCC